MSSFQDARWLRRLWSLAAPGDPTADYVANVQVVNDARYRGSRERAPYASHSALLSAPGAGIHNFVELGGTDGLPNLELLLHRWRIEVLVDMANNLTGLVQAVLAVGSTLTTATRVATTPMFRDSDPDVTPTLFLGTIATANIPAAAVALPRAGTSGLTGATPSFNMPRTEIDPMELGFAQSWQGPNSLILYAPANTSAVFSAVWQAFRG